MLRNRPSDTPAGTDPLPRPDLRTARMKRGILLTGITSRLVLAIVFSGLLWAGYLWAVGATGTS